MSSREETITERVLSEWISDQESLSWIAGRPPTQEEVGDEDWCLVTTLGGRVVPREGVYLRICWNNVVPIDPIAWMPMPESYQPPPPQPEAGELWENLHGGNVFVVGFGRRGTVVYQWFDTGSLKESSPEEFTKYFTRLT